MILGKTNCPEFAAGANTFNDVFGRTRNPWDHDEVGRRIDRRRSGRAGDRHDRARRRHRSRRIAAHSGRVLRRRRIASVRRIRAHASDRLGVGHAAGHRADGAHGRRRGADAADDRRAERVLAACAADRRPRFRARRAEARARICASPIAPTSPASASIPTSSACAARPRSRSPRKARSSRRFTSISPPRGRRFFRCAACGSSRRCSRGSICRIASARTSATTCAPASR